VGGDGGGGADRGTRGAREERDGREDGRCRDAGTDEEGAAKPFGQGGGVGDGSLGLAGGDGGGDGEADRVRYGTARCAATVRDRLSDAGVLSDPRVGPSATFGKDWLPGNYSTSPEEASATGRPVRDPLKREAVAPPRG
jgi:hypothetical protein